MAAAAAGLILGLLFYWFAIANRYAVFLYGHLGATPFDQVTSTRYWMSGLVAGSVVLSVNVALSWLAGRLLTGYHPLDWRNVWLWAGPAAFAGAVLICLFGGRPELPIGDAIAVGAVSALALALALSPARLAARAPGRLLWYALHGASIAPSLLLVRALELPGRLPSVSTTTAVVAAAGSLAAGAAGLTILAAIGKRRTLPTPGLAAVLGSGFALAYLVLPLAHHLFATPPGFRYISASASFFAEGWSLQAVAWAAAAVVAAASARLDSLL